MDTSAITGVLGQQGQQTTTGHDAYNKLDLNTFVKMLIAELQSQDPMNPVNNSEILQQVSQIKQIATDQQLTETLQAVQLGQNVATAGGLLGKTITGLSEKGDQLTGRVDRVTIEDGVPLLHIGEQTIPLKNVSALAS
jgi:flagellar basal-body rod modification protein FlgD